MSDTARGTASGSARGAALAAAVLALLAGLVWFLPEDHARLDLVYVGTIAAAGLTVLARAATSRAVGGVRRGWTLVGVGLVSTACGEALWIAQARAGLDPFMSWADALFVAGTCAMVGGVLVLAHVGHGRLHRWALLDVLIVAVGVTSVLWLLTIQPYADDPNVSAMARMAIAVYPMLDVVLVGTVARMVIAGRAPTGSLLLLLGSMSLFSVADITYYVQEIAGTYVEWGWVDALTVLALGGIAVAALHPATFRPPPPRARPPIVLGRRRMFVLAGIASTPLVLVAANLAGDTTGQTSVLALFAIAATGLLLARTWTLIDVTEEVGELRGEQRFRSMIANANDAIVVLDDRLHITFASPSLERMWGHDVDALLGQPLEVLLVPGHEAAVRTWLSDLAAGLPTRSIAAVWRDRRSEQQSGGRDVHMSASDLRHDPAIGGLLVTGRDISDRVALERELRLRAELDPLTQLANRDTFQTRLDEVIAELDTTVLFIDLDDFKHVNDSLGHHAGDAVLVEVARRLRALVRPTDLAARLGGDEFALLLIGGEAQSIAERVAADLSSPMMIGDERIVTTVSIGVADVPRGCDADDALRRADLAMYAAKHGGKDRVTAYVPSMAEDAGRQLQLRTKLRTAVSDGTLRIAYQPIVRTTDRWTVAVEALLRWELDGVPVGPDEFIPVAEASGDIVPIGAWVLEQACLDVARELGTADDGPVVSVNVSAVQLDHDLDAAVIHALAVSGLPAHRLQLELTESLMADELPAAAFLRLRALGVKLAIDDFGTGWCSLSYLRRFPVDVIKVDRTFLDDEAGIDLIDGIVRLIRATGATCVAEGVETERQLALLGDVGVETAQGWLFARAIPIEEVSMSMVIAAAGYAG